MVLDSGKCIAIEFLQDELTQLREGGKHDHDKTAMVRFLNIFQQFANYGVVAPKRLLKYEKNGLLAFKDEVRNVQVRFPCFPDGRRMLLTHGFLKRGVGGGLGKWLDSEFERAERIRAEYYRRKQLLGVTKSGEGNRGKNSG
ncbi:MAG: hypothetical protein U0791_23445 [Gemmataceae bacterium]